MTNWGIISTARINEPILAAARASDSVQILGVASRDLARAQAYALENGLDRAYGSYDELLADPGIEAVYISLPNHLHVEWSIRALEAGKHVLCEKPLSRSPREIERAFDAADRAGRHLMEAFMWRHHPQVARVRELVAEGAIGPVLHVRARFSFPLEALRGSDDIRFVAAYDGGSLMDTGCYCVSAVRLFLGEPERVLGEQVVGPSGVDLTFCGSLRFPGDRTAQFLTSFALPIRQELEVIGEEGTISLGAPFRVDSLADVVIHRGDEAETVAVPKADSYRLELENLSAAAAGRAEPLLGRADALGQARAIEALYRSAGEGRAVSL